MVLKFSIQVNAVDMSFEFGNGIKRVVCLNSKKNLRMVSLKNSLIASPLHNTSALAMCTRSTVLLVCILYPLSRHMFQCTLSLHPCQVQIRFSTVQINQVHKNTVVCVGNSWRRFESTKIGVGSCSQCVHQYSTY